MANYIIIGSGATGISAAGAIRKEDPRAVIQMFTNDPYVHYSRPGLAYLLAEEVPQNQIYPVSKEYFNELNIQIIKLTVSSILLQQKLVKTENNKFFRYDSLLLATGSTASMPKVPGIELEGVVKLDTMEDAERIINIARKARSAVVIGGGITALEIAEGFAAIGLTVHYFLRGDRYWSNVLDETESRMVEDHLMQLGIKVHYYTELVEIQGKKGKVSGVFAKQKENLFELPCQIIAFAIGIKPRIDLAVQTGLKTQRGVIVDEGLHTSHPDVFAAGDVAQVFDRRSGEYIVDSLWRPAIEQGWVAGLNMTGKNYFYERKSPFNVTRLGGIITTIIGRLGNQPEDEKKNDRKDVIGIMHGDSEIWQKQSIGVVAQTYKDNNRLRLYVGQNYLTGAIVMGDQTLSRPLQILIREQVDISAIRDILLSPNASLAETLRDFWEDYRQRNARQIA